MVFTPLLAGGQPSFIRQMRSFSWSKRYTDEVRVLDSIPLQLAPFHSMGWISKYRYSSNKEICAQTKREIMRMYGRIHKKKKKKDSSQVGKKIVYEIVTRKWLNSEQTGWWPVSAGYLTVLPRCLGEQGPVHKGRRPQGTGWCAMQVLVDEGLLVLDVINAVDTDLWCSGLSTIAWTAESSLPSTLKDLTLPWGSLNPITDYWEGERDKGMVNSVQMWTLLSTYSTKEWNHLYF